MKKLLSLTILFVFMFQFVTLAAPARPSNLYVLDSAGVLSNQLKTHIITSNQELSYISTAEVVVVTTQFTDGLSIAQYSENIFNQWGLGGANENNGVLIVFVIAQDDYYIAVGDGHSMGLLSGGVLGAVFEEIEQYFAHGSYEEAMGVAFDNIFNIVYNYYVINPMSYQGSNAPAGVLAQAQANIANQQLVQHQQNIGGGFINFLVTIIIIFLVIVFLTNMMRPRRMMGPNMMMGRRRGFGGFGGFGTGFIMGNMMGRRRPPRGGGWGGNQMGMGMGGSAPRPRVTVPKTGGGLSKGGSYGGGLSKGGSYGGGMGRTSIGGRGGGRTSGGGLGRRR